MSTASNNNVAHALTASVIEGLASRDDFIGLGIAPGISQPGIKGNFPVIRLESGEMMRSNMERRKAGTEFKKVEVSVELEETILGGDGVDVVIPKEVAEDTSAAGLDMLTVYGEEAYLNGLRLHEQRVANLAQGNGFNAENGSVPYIEANLATVDVPLDLQKAIRRIKGRGERPDEIVFPAEVWDFISRTDKMAKYIAGQVNPTSLVTPESLQLAFSAQGIKRVRIAEAYVNNSAKGKSDKIETIWSNSHIWVGAGSEANPANPTGGSNRIRSAMATFFWDKFGMPFVLKKMYDEIGTESWIIRAWGITNEQIVNAKAGERITTRFA